MVSVCPHSLPSFGGESEDAAAALEEGTPQRGDTSSSTAPRGGDTDSSAGVAVVGGGGCAKLLTKYLFAAEEHAGVLDRISLKDGEPTLRHYGFSGFQQARYNALFALDHFETRARFLLVLFLCLAIGAAIQYVVLTAAATEVPGAGKGV